MASFRTTSVALLAACVLAITAGCASDPNEADVAAGGVTVGFSNPQALQPSLATFQESLTVAGDKLGIEVTSSNAALSVSKQVSDLESFVTSRVDAIVVFPLSTDAIRPVVERARAAGIKVVGFSGVFPEDGQTPDAGPFDANLDQGISTVGAKAASDFVAERLGGKGNVLCVNFGGPVPALIALEQAYERFVTEGNPGIQWLGTAVDETDDLAGAQTTTADAITRFPQGIDAVMAYTDLAAIGAAQALAAAGAKDAVIIGQQGNPEGVAAIRSGQIDGDIDPKPWRQALTALAMVRGLLNGETVPAFVTGEVDFLTEANVDTYVPWDDAIEQIRSGKIPADVDV